MRRRISGKLVVAATGANAHVRSGRGPRIFVAAHAADCSGCAAYVARLSEHCVAIDDWGGRLSVVTAGALPLPTGEMGASGVELLLAEDTAAAVGIEPAGLVIADEWGEVYFEVSAGARHDFPDPAEVIEWIRFVAIQCPECEQPEGEWRSLP